MRLALPVCLSGLTCPDEVPVMVVKLQPPSCHLTSYNDRHLSLPSARLSLHQKRVQKLPYPSPTRWDPQKPYFPGGCPEALVTQSRHTGTFTCCGLCVRKQLHSYETVHKARPRMSHMTKWGCLQNQGQLGKKPHCIRSPSFSASILSFHLFCTCHKTLACKRCLSLHFQADTSPWRVGSHFVNQVITSASLLVEKPDT